MKITSLLLTVAIASSVAFLANTFGSTDALTSCGIFTAALLALTAMSDYGPRRSFALAPKPRQVMRLELRNGTLFPVLSARRMGAASLAS